MKRIVCAIQPFGMKQEIYVYDDNNKIDVATPLLEDINPVIFAFVDKYKLTKIDLLGPKQFVAGLIRKMKIAEIATYGKNTLKINEE